MKAYDKLVKKYTQTAQKIFDETIKTNPQAKPGKSIDKALIRWNLSLVGLLATILTLIAFGVIYSNNDLVISGLVIDIGTLIFGIFALKLRNNIKTNISKQADINV